MRLAIATDDNVTISSRFRHCKSFVVMEIDGGQVKKKEIRDNLFAKTVTRKHHGSAKDCSNCSNHHLTADALKGCSSTAAAGCDGNHEIADAIKDCDVVISRGMGGKSKDKLSKAAIGYILTDLSDIDLVVGAFIEGKLVSNEELRCQDAQGCSAVQRFLSK